MDIWGDVGKLLKNWHDDELNETSLSTCDIGRGSIAHHGDIKALSLFHIALIEKLIEQQVSPLSA